MAIFVCCFCLKSGTQQAKHNFNYNLSFRINHFQLACRKNMLFINMPLLWIICKLMRRWQKAVHSVTWMRNSPTKCDNFPQKIFVKLLAQQFRFRFRHSQTKLHSHNIKNNKRNSRNESVTNWKRIWRRNENGKRTKKK